MNVILSKSDGSQQKHRIKDVFVFEGTKRVKLILFEVEIFVLLLVLEDFEIGDTLADLENPEALPRISVDEPTMSMLFTINDSPFFGKEGKFVTSRHLRDALQKN